MGACMVLVGYTVKPGMEEVAFERIAALVANVLRIESDCAGITLTRSAEDACRILLIERWPSREVFLGPHMQQPHLQDFIQVAGEFLAGPPEIRFWDVVEAP